MFLDCCDNLVLHLSGPSRNPDQAVTKIGFQSFFRILNHHHLTSVSWLFCEFCSFLRSIHSSPFVFCTSLHRFFSGWQLYFLGLHLRLCQNRFILGSVDSQHGSICFAVPFLSLLIEKCSIFIQMACRWTKTIRSEEKERGRRKRE